MIEKGYVAFISYRHESPDMEIAQKLHKAIETYRIPGSVRKKTGRLKTGRVFRDQEELPLSANLGEDIENALENSEWFIAVCSPRYLKSLWCMRELEYFIEKKGKSHVLTVLTEGEPENSFPEALLYRTDEHGNREAVEPLAADVRGATKTERLKKLKGEKLRLLAPILNVTYDDLRMRERQRRRKRIITAAAAVLIAAGSLAGVLARNAALQREAQEKQRMAEEERRNAVSNSIGTSLAEASAFLENNDNRRSAEVLLDALALSGENEDLRREEILGQLRKTMYIAPFTVVSRLDLQNVQMASAQVSPDGKKLICITNSNSILLLDLETGEPVYTVSRGSAQIDETAFSPDGSRFLAINDFYRCVTVWNTDDGKEIFTYTGLTGEQQSVPSAFFWKGSDALLIRDGDQFFTVSVPDGKAELFYTMGDQQEGYDGSKALHAFRSGISFDQIAAEFSDLGSMMMGCPVVISRDGSKVLIGGQTGDTGTILLNDRGERIALLERMPGLFTDRYDISPDGKYVSCQTMMGFMAVWDAETGKLLCIKALDLDFSNGTSAPVFSPDSSMAAFVHKDSLFIMDAPNGNGMTSVDIRWEQDFEPIIHWSSDGKTLILYTPNLYMVDAKTRSVLLSREADTPNNRFSNAVPAGNEVVFVTRTGGEAVLYSLPGFSSVTFREEYHGELIPGDSAGTDECPWDELPAGEHRMNDVNHILSGTTGIEPIVTFSADLEYAALIYDDGAIEVFRREDSRHVYLLNRQYYELPYVLGFTGDWMAAAGKDGGIMFQNLEDGSITNLNTDTVYVSFRYCGNMLMALREDRRAADVFDAENPELLFSMQSAVPITSFGFSENGAEAVAVTENGEYLVADLWQNESALLEQARRFAPGH